MFSIDEEKTRDIERENFQILKEKENKHKKFPHSDDILLVSDFIFQEYENTGDSGDLYLAVSKKDENEKYLVKHAYYDCCCNEYMYSKLGNKMGIKIVPVKLFYVDSSRELFKSDFVCGIKYLENSSHIKYEILEKNHQVVKNFEDYFRILGLDCLLMGGDGIEILKHQDYLYRIDMSSSFLLSDFDLYLLAYDFVYKGIDLQKYARDRLLKKASLQNFQETSEWETKLDVFKRHYDKKYLKYFQEPFSLIQKITRNDIKEWTDLLTYFYPEVVGEYYQVLIESIQREARIFLEKNEQGK